MNLPCGCSKTVCSGIVMPAVTWYVVAHCQGWVVTADWWLCPVSSHGVDPVTNMQHNGFKLQFN